MKSLYEPDNTKIVNFSFAAFCNTSGGEKNFSSLTEQLSEANCQDNILGNCKCTVRKKNNIMLG